MKIMLLFSMQIQTRYYSFFKRGPFTEDFFVYYCVTRFLVSFYDCGKYKIYDWFGIFGFTHCIIRIQFKEGDMQCCKFKRGRVKDHIIWTLGYDIFRESLNLLRKALKNSRWVFELSVSPVPCKFKRDIISFRFFRILLGYEIFSIVLWLRKAQNLQVQYYHNITYH